MKVELVPISSITPYQGNPRINKDAVTPVANSIKAFGFQQPLVLDAEGVIIAGHTRLLAAKQLGLKEVPVVKASELTPDQVKAYRLADNKSAEFAQWEWGMVGTELIALMETNPDLVPPTGFDAEEIRRAIAWNEEGNGVRTFEPEERPVPLTKKGDVWTSDSKEHVVLCTENTSSLFKKYLEHRQIDCIITDPPYNVSYASRHGVVNNDTHESYDAFGSFIAECFTPAIAKLRLGGALFTCGNNICYHPINEALTPLGVPLAYELFWVKSRFVYSPGPMQFMKQHENIWVGWKKGAARHENPTITGKALLLDDREDWEKMSKEELLERLISIHEAFSTVREAKHEHDKLANHPTVKPTALFLPLIRKSTLPGDTVCDIFAGVGVTALACHELARKSISVELDPSYVDCILDRLYQHKKVDFTNQDGVRWSTLRDQPLQAKVESNLDELFQTAATA